MALYPSKFMINILKSVNASVHSIPFVQTYRQKQVNRHPRANASGDKARGWRPWEVTSEHSASVS